MKTRTYADDNRTLENRGFRSLFDTEVNIKIRALTIIAIAGAIGNSLGFLANLFLYGFNFVTAFCAICAALLILFLFFGVQSSHGTILGYILLFILDAFEFPLLTLTYGAVMYPYMIIGFHGLVMITEKRKRTCLAVLLGIYDLAIIVYSSFNPYIFGPQDPIGLLGSAVITFSISLVTVASLVIMWQNVYLVDTIELDSVTGAHSRAGFVKNAKKILLEDRATDYSLLYFNVFSFKAINSIYGIEGGDRFLKTVARYLSGSSFGPRIVARLSADRFVCLAEKRKVNPNDMADICRIPFEENGREVLVYLNCGIYEIDDRAISIDAMIDRAATAIRLVHSAGNMHYAYFNSDAEEMYKDETFVLSEIDKAITAGQFHPFYQPVVDCNTREIVSAEALARWIHPEKGIISPAVFIPVLEKKNLISNLDRMIAGKVYEFISESCLKNQKIVPISINLSRDDFFDSSMMQDIRAMLENMAENDHYLRFEITESVYEDMAGHMMSLVSELREHGSKVYVDDFGSGYSSLGMITDYQFDVIKLDMQFASKIIEGERNIGVVRSIIDMSHKLGAKVIAEGIESEEQFNLMRECGCDYIQGYYFYKPLSEKEFAALINGPKAAQS